jgi:CRP-like cAMP-binding protein
MEDPIGRVYFTHSGIVSLPVDPASGEMIESAMMGRDSVVGCVSALEGPFSLNRAVVQVAWTASVLPAEQLRQVAGQSVLRTTLIRRWLALLAQSQQTAACNARHSVEPRLARWLLRCRKLLNSDDIPLTQGCLARTRGVRRTSVTVTARTLQAAGLITHQHGRNRIHDAEGLTGARTPRDPLSPNRSAAGTRHGSSLIVLPARICSKLSALRQVSGPIDSGLRIRSSGNNNINDRNAHRCGRAPLTIRGRTVASVSPPVKRPPDVNHSMRSTAR